MRLPIIKPQPDIEWFKKVILGEVIPTRPPLAELFLDLEVVAIIAKEYLGRKLVYPGKDIESRKAYWDTYIEVYYRLGYDYVRIAGGVDFSTQFRLGDDSAELSRGKRNWTEEGTGPITSWETFEQYPWPSLDTVSLWDYEYCSSHLPEGMGMFVCPSSGFLEVPMDYLLGYENMSYLLLDEPELVNAVVEKTGSLIYEFYKKVLGLPKMVGFFQGDDMGYKTSTLFSPAFLREQILPWHKKTAALAHENNLLYMLHCCGNIESIMDDLIDDVKIDAKHSYEEEAISAPCFKKKYGDRVSMLGGIDVDRLCRLPEEELRKYVRDTLDICMEGGRFALGSGNTVCNYVPVRNYLIMLEEGWNWGK